MICFSSGDPTYNPVNEFFKDYGMYVAFAFAGAVLLAVIVLTILALSKRKKAQNNVEIKEVVSGSEVLAALGGKENVISHSLNGSRIVLELKDYSLVNEKELNALGVASVIKMSNKITLVIKGDSKAFYNMLF